MTDQHPSEALSFQIGLLKSLSGKEQLIQIDYCVEQAKQLEATQNEASEQANQQPVSGSELGGVSDGESVPSVGNKLQADSSKSPDAKVGDG